MSRFSRVSSLSWHVRWREPAVYGGGVPGGECHSPPLRPVGLAHSLEYPASVSPCRTGAGDLRVRRCYTCPMLNRARHAGAESRARVAPEAWPPLAELPSERRRRQQELRGHADELWRRFWPQLPPLQISVEVSARLVGKAGYYVPSGPRIVLSGRYLSLYGAEEARATLLHELAHHAARLVHGDSTRPHGREFLAEMGRLGFPRHCRDTGPLKRLRYACPACGRVYGRQRRIGRRPVACGPCCRRHSRGRYDGRFRLVEVPADPPHPGA